MQRIIRLIRWKSGQYQGKFPMSRQPDAIDLKILEALESDGRLSIVDLAQRVNLTNTPCS
jgi:hypothetical protein